MQLITARYLATQPDRDPDVLAENIAREQSLELTRALIPDPVAERFLGRVLNVIRLDDERWQLDIGYPMALASKQIGQLLQLVYGNVSFYPRIRLTGLTLPESLFDRLPGPIGGIGAIRSAIDVPERALLMTVLKPRGSAVDSLAALALAFARGGGDIVKDDQNLVDAEPVDFALRVTACARAMERAADETGRRCLYLPHVAGSGAHLQCQLDIVAGLGLKGVVLCPWIMGLESAAHAARERGLMWLAHPAMAGVLTEPADRGIASPVLLGTLVRAAGADISIFPGPGGRIRSGQVSDIQTTCQALTRPMGSLAPTLPCFGGGKTLDQAPEVAAAQGPDCALLVGGDLIGRGAGIQADTARTIDALNALTRP